MSRRVPHFFMCLVMGLGLAIGGCAAEQKRAESQAAGADSLSTPDPALNARARTVSVFRGRDGSPVAWDSMIESAAGADAVIIGENHGHSLGLAFASEFWVDVLARCDRAVLSMEFFTRDEQSRLDDYLRGLTDEATFLRATRRTTDAAYSPGHRAMVRAARDGSRPVIAANAPRAYVRAASRESYEYLGSLTEEQRRMFRIPDVLPVGKYRSDYDALMSDPAMASHGGPPIQETPEALRKRLDSTFRAQSLWDWTMADSVARAIDRDGRPVVHVVGRFHSDFGGGLNQAISALRPGTGIVTISVVDAWSDSLREDDRDRADFVVYVGGSR